ncbi:hypothetical protein [Rhizorhabdus dicambivorans]|uniref:Uncharacterized protein n=1 Tax=Rhizorhabdus dicambivorans TaxID=1850238 RepID=A0A2A4FW94_9SPHN|nr:hypothetical protein [Rhizorhabdus dicambivorans]ATE65946.1 hypothetical protein CMV14_17315 [Rhizorhabdus dicambivorans]PCE43061.1 hypothetical protein COO09_07100 [Rhizorhabdus dicambivorans]
MKIRIDEFRIDTAQPAEAPLDFVTLCALLAEHQAATPTARCARDGQSVLLPDPSHPAVAILLAGPGQAATSGSVPGSFHAAAAALFRDGSR